ncbi:MAG: EscU/YscU/HrcU family type III secretion system export apparatus switch protein [Nocardioidaceae bacterium]|nr:EscU/YscU/HrcU family type III secretion system export apparatus switch protein [Nocardioidaceae bacterium]
MAGGSEEKTEKATPKKLKQSRKEGQVARTPELGAWASMLGVAMAMDLLVGHATDAFRELLVTSLRTTATPTEHHALELLGRGTHTALVLSVGLGAMVLVVGGVAAIGQGGFFVATKALKPKWSRLNPLAGAKRLFGPHALWEGAKILAKSTVLGLLVWRAVVDLMPTVGGLMPIDAAVQQAGAAAVGLMRNIALAGLAAAAADYAMARRRTGKQTRMTKKEVREEHKQAEGDPHMKGAIRSRQLAAARSRMMAAVPEADVVLVNPTHVAVALRYEPSKGTPRVVAKGAGAVAGKIRELAEANRVSMVEDVPLARALHASCEVGQEIPPQLYHAVAQVLAFVLSLRAAGAASGKHRSPRLAETLPDVPRSRRRRRAPASA